jgi:predicted nucleic acid-binding Zn ribbon protein
VLTELVRSLGLGDPAEPRLRAHWAEAVGAEDAARCGVEKLEDGRLTVAAETAVHRHYLWMRAETLRRRANAFLGADVVKEVHVKLRRAHGREG